jgi:hypothetical protein
MDKSHVNLKSATSLERKHFLFFRNKYLCHAMTQAGKDDSGWMESTVAMILTLSVLFSNPEAYLDVGFLRMYLRADSIANNETVRIGPP